MKGERHEQLQHFVSRGEEKIVRLHLEEGRTMESLAMEYSVSKSGISRWVKEFRKECQENLIAKEELDSYELLNRLRKENEELKKENVFLKKAAAFFAKEII